MTRLPALDGLRAVALLAVLVCHASGALGGWWSTSVALWEAGGTMGGGLPAQVRRHSASRKRWYSSALRENDRIDSDPLDGAE